MLRHLRSWWHGAAGAPDAVDTFHPQGSSSSERNWHPVVVTSSGDGPDHAEEQGPEPSLLPSMVEEARASDSRHSHKATVVTGLAAPHPLEGTWIADDLCLEIPHELSSFRIHRAILETAHCVEYTLAHGPTPDSITLGDLCLSLQLHGFIRMRVPSGRLLLYERVDRQVHSTLSSLQGRWEFRGETRRHRKTITVQGAIYTYSFQHNSSQGLLHLENGDIKMKEFKLKAFGQDAFHLEGPSGHCWRFRRTRGSSQR